MKAQVSRLRKLGVTHHLEEQWKNLLPFGAARYYLARTLQIIDVLRDRGSRYAVSGGPVQGQAGVSAFLTDLKRAKKFAKATHNTWAVVLSETGAVKSDDGEAGAGAVILKMLERAELRDHIVVVTRWYGGVHLGGDRFAHVVSAVRAYLEALAKT